MKLDTHIAVHQGMKNM